MKTRSADSDGCRPRSAKSLALLLGAFSVAAPSSAQITEVGGIARDFVVTNRGTGQPIHLYDYDGQVILLDFFAYWCGPCRSSSPDVEVNVNQYYADRGGNPSGVPVTVLPVNIEDGNEGATDTFIQEAGLDLVANDYTGSAYNQFETGFIPLFVIINGVADSPSHLQWEVLHRDSGYPGADTFRQLIDGVEASALDAPPDIVQAPVGQTVRAGDPLRLEVRATGTRPLAYQWYRDGQRLEGAIQATFELSTAQLADAGGYFVTVTNAFGAVQSEPVTVRVVRPGPIETFTATQVGLAIPDDNLAGITSQLTIPQALEVQRLRVFLRITHTWIGDLRVVLESPAGTQAILHEYAGGGTENLALEGVVRHEFDGENAQGIWSLSVADGAALDEGTLDSWSLEIESPAPSLVDRFVPWIESYPGLLQAERDPGADPDGDGVANIVEYVLEGRSPEVAEARPGLTAAPGLPDYFEYALTWREGVPVETCQILITRDLGRIPWHEAANEGTEVVVDRTDPRRITVRVSRALPRAFLRLQVQ